MVPALIGLALGGLYYLAAFALLGRFKVKKEQRFLIATIPLGAFSIVWMISAFTYNSWGGIGIAIMLLLDAGAVWFVRKKYNL